MNKQIFFILTGGTIDSKTKGRKRDILLERSAIPYYLQKQKFNKNLGFVEIVWKDSRDVTRADRNKILRTIEESDAQKIIITHGTFTMAKTGQFLKKNLARKDRVIILTGAMSPLLFKNSDAPSNLKFSLKMVKKLRPGVYICMHKRVLDPIEAVKDIKKEKIYSIHDKNYNT